MWINYIEIRKFKEVKQKREISKKLFEMQVIRPITVAS